MKRIPFVLIFLLSFIYKSHGQADQTSIDHILPPCYKIKNNLIIKELILKGHYQGKVLLEAYCDTIKNILADYKIVYAKLISTSDPNDSIEIRLENKTGNFEFIEKNKTIILNL